VGLIGPPLGPLISDLLVKHAEVLGDAIKRTPLLERLTFARCPTDDLPRLRFSAPPCRCTLKFFLSFN
jgi:hypothetical protein